jgi:hypothetical protein
MAGLAAGVHDENERKCVKKTINIIIGLAVMVFARQMVQAQGTLTYLSNLGQPSTGSVPVGSDSWLAMQFATGHDTGGYLLDSIQLAMANASGNPNGFTVMVYEQPQYAPGIVPGSSLGTLNGSANPSTPGIYTYTPTSSLVLSPSTIYFIVLASGTEVANGAYEWSVASAGTTSDNWEGWFASFDSNNSGSNWKRAPVIYGQYAITATPIPEPSSLWLLLLGSGIFIYARRYKFTSGIN